MRPVLLQLMLMILTRLGKEKVVWDLKTQESLKLQTTSKIVSQCVASHVGSVTVAAETWGFCTLGTAAASTAFGSVPGAVAIEPIEVLSESLSCGCCAIEVCLATWLASAGVCPGIHNLCLDTLSAKEADARETRLMQEIYLTDWRQMSLDYLDLLFLPCRQLIAEGPGKAVQQVVPHHLEQCVQKDGRKILHLYNQLD